MKVLQVISYSPIYLHEGPSSVALLISRELVKRGHEVTVFTTDASRLKSRLRIPNNPIVVDGVKICHFRNLNNQLASKNIPVAPNMALALKKDIKSFDLVHLHEYRTCNAAFVHHYAKRENVPFILQPHGSLPKVRQNVVERQLIRSAFDSIWGLRILRDATAVEALQESEANQCRQLGVEDYRIRIIPNAIRLVDYESLPEEGTFRRKYGLEQEDIVILSLGRIHKVKGLDLLLDAFFDISPELPEAKLVIAGPDDGFLSVLEKKIEDAQIGNRVTFTGPLYGRAKLAAYRDADVFVMPSRYDIFGLTVLEASACGTPVIVTDRCGIADVVKKYGLVVEYDAKQLRDALLSVLENDAKRQELAEKVKDLVQKEFRLDRVIEKVEEMYNEAVNTK